MHDALVALLNRERVDAPGWRSFWEQLEGGQLERGEAVALLASLSTQLPDHDTLSCLLSSLDERRPPVTVQYPGAVNIVGTGGGPSTFNISTAAAFVAATLGATVVKSGSRAYTSSCGSIDLLERLGIPLSKSYEHTGELLEQFRLAFAGYFVYPKELTLLGRNILPLGLRPFGRFFNSVGPFLAALPVSAQVTGVSGDSLLPHLRGLASNIRDRTVWLCVNAIGADELVSFADNVIYTNSGGGGEIRLSARQLGADAGTIGDLRPADNATLVVAHFLDAVSGRGGPVASRTISLNAAAMVVASGLTDDWTAAVTAASEVIESGAALDLINRMRSPAKREASLSKAGTP
ncbi:MAG TPA: hypothetical protein VGJ86_25550 [Acidimicrobiales bacterium]|jgi:anthranilate phosphoribosyltransferase